MLEFVQILHEAFRTESRWLFVLYIGLGFALCFGIVASAIAFVVDTGYQRTLREQKSVTSTSTPAPPPIVIRDTAEEDRLRSENTELKRQLDEREQRRKDQKTVAEFLEKGNLLKASCDSLQERPDLVAVASQWAQGTNDALQKINPSYAARFQAATGPTYSRDLDGKPLPAVNNNVWNWLNLRTDALARILETMPN